MAEKDLENGDPKRERISFADGWDPDKDEGEYANLIRYISTYRDRRFSKAPSQVSGEEGGQAAKMKVPFYKRMFGVRAGLGELYEVPEEWLNTDIKTGLTSAEVETRRHKTGFNELQTEKENMFLKFIGYFRGPILYGMSTAPDVDDPPEANHLTHGSTQSWNSLSSWPPVFVTGSILVSSLAS